MIHKRSFVASWQYRTVRSESRKWKRRHHDRPLLKVGLDGEVKRLLIVVSL